MNNNYILDTNFICSFFNKKDENHGKALKIFNSLPLICNFYIPDTVYLELIIFQLKFLKNSGMDLKNLIHSLKINRLAIDQKFIDNFHYFCEKTSLNLKTIDYTILYSCYISNAHLLSFDKKPEKAYNNVRVKRAQILGIKFLA